MNFSSDLLLNRMLFFNFMKEKYRLFENSNIFFRDVQYAIKNYYEKKEKKISYAEAEKTAWEFIKTLEDEGQLKKISQNAWKVNFSLATNVIEVVEEKMQQN